MADVYPACHVYALDQFPIPTRRAIMTTLTHISEDLANLVKHLDPSVVRVEARRRLPATGIVWSADGLIITAHHVVTKQEGIRVGLADGRTVDARLIGRDPTTDLALLQVQEQGLVPPTWADVDGADLSVGQLVVALGRTGQTVRAALGMMSALGDPWRSPGGGRIDRYLQIDLVMYPGFSGGPLVNAAGQVVGLNTSALLRNVNVAIPVATVNRVGAMLRDHGRIRRGFLGVSTQPVRLPEKIAAQVGQETGLLLTAVVSGSPAEQGGLVLGDTLISLDGTGMRQHDDLVAFMGLDRIGQTSLVKLLRGGQIQEVQVVIGECT
jgi:S1-C subfamily serine protease